MALKEHPGEQQLARRQSHYNSHVHIGVAVAVDEGLLVPWCANASPTARACA